MALISLPPSFRPSGFSLTPYVNQRVSASNFGGSEQAIDMLNDRWQATVELPVRKFNEAAELEAFIGAMRGQVNTVLLHHFARPSVRGSIAGARTLATAAPQGAGSISITASGDVKAGDMLGVGGLLLMAREDAASVAGVITVPLVNRLRRAQASGLAVTTYKAAAPFRLLATSGVNYVPGYASTVSFDFGEVP